MGPRGREEDGERAVLAGEEQAWQAMERSGIGDLVKHMKSAKRSLITMNHFFFAIGRYNMLSNLWPGVYMMLGGGLTYQN